MGQAKRTLERMLAKQPRCIYCGGQALAVSRDHCPPIGIFDGRRRPQGLEFPACYACHQGTRQMDQIASVLSRMYPEPTTDEQRAEQVEVIRGFIANHRALAQRIYGQPDELVSFDGKPAHVMHVGDVTELHRAMNGFAARLGLALYYQERGLIAPPRAPIVCRWYSNYELASGEGPAELVRQMGNARTLSMGQQHVFPQFRYWSATASDNPDYFGCFAVFRESFAVFAGIDATEGREERFPGTLRPGFLRGYDLSTRN